MRPYQLEAVEAVEAAWNSHRSTLLVMATGLGKTVTFAHIIDRTPSGRTMVIAHREELIRQGASKIEAVTGRPCEIEMADERADFNRFNPGRVVVASKDTLHEKRLARFDPSTFSRLIIDEAHHAVADTYRRIIDWAGRNPACKVLGVTATPDRLDEQALGKVFGSVAMVYDIVDGINDGYLVPISQRLVSVDSLDYAKLHTLAGDFNSKDLAELMEYEENLHKVADPIMRLARWKKTLVFAASVAHGERLAEILNRHRNGSARFISGKTPTDDRKTILHDFKAGKFQFLVNVGVFTEGFDEPTIELVAVARPTKSRALYAQMIGRGTRPLPGLVESLAEPEERRAAITASRKPCLEVLDFEGNSGQHKLITVADVLGGDHDDEIIEAANQAARAAGKPLDMLIAIAAAQKDRYAQRERERAILLSKRNAIRGKTEFSTKVVDPFNVLDLEPWRARGWDHNEPATEKQVAFLDKAGVPTVSLTKNMARQLITEVIHRRNTGACTYKQAKILKKHGYDGNATFGEAHNIIDALAANGWRRLPVGGGVL